MQTETDMDVNRSAQERAVVLSENVALKCPAALLKRALRPLLAVPDGEKSPHMSERPRSRAHCSAGPLERSTGFGVNINWFLTWEG